MVRLRVREVAESLGWNAARLARKADLSNTAMYGIWNGTTDDPGIRTLEAIAKALGVKVRDLIDENGDATIKESIEAPMLAGAPA
jgi:transcriptional regulator with XRE-family HTH domain